jgi:hypothetical protein
LHVRDTAASKIEHQGKQNFLVERLDFFFIGCTVSPTPLYHFFFGSGEKDFTINIRSCSTMVSSPMFLSRGLVATLALAQTFGLASGAERFNEIKV